MNVPSKLSIIDAIVFFNGILTIESDKQTRAMSRLSTDADEYAALAEARIALHAEQSAVEQLFDIVRDKSTSGATDREIIRAMSRRALDVVYSFEELKSSGHALTRDEDVREAFFSSVLSAIAAWEDSSYIKLQSI